MPSNTRRSFLKATPLNAGGLTAALAGVGETSATPAAALDRRAFLEGSVGAAAGAVLVIGGPHVASAALGGPTSTRTDAVIVKPSGPPPSETVMAYVRDAEKNEVTVLSGQHETTYRDPQLTQRLLDAAR
jgi:hypothetical protein